MTTLQITLPDDLASDAAKAGLLTTERLEEMFRAQLRAEAGARMFEMMKALHAVSGPPMSMDEINAEVKAARRERREKLQAASR